MQRELPEWARGRKLPRWAQTGTATLNSHERAAIAAATQFSAVFVRGTAGTVTEVYDSLGAARAAAARLNTAHGQYGRRAVVYAIGQRGALFPVPADWPETQEAR